MTRFVFSVQLTGFVRRTVIIDLFPCQISPARPEGGRPVIRRRLSMAMKRSISLLMRLRSTRIQVSQQPKKNAVAPIIFHSMLPKVKSTPPLVKQVKMVSPHFIVVSFHTIMSAVFKISAAADFLLFGGKVRSPEVSQSLWRERKQTH